LSFNVHHLKASIIIVGFFVIGLMYLSFNGAVHKKTSQDIAFPKLSTHIMLANNFYIEHRNHGIEVEILNGSGISDLASITTDYLRSKHFDVVYYGNADQQSYEHTLIIQRNEKYHSLKLIGEAFDVDFKDKNHVMLAPDESLCLDVTVILGKDYTSKEELMDFIFNYHHKNRKSENNIFQILSALNLYNHTSKSSLLSK